MSNQAPVTVWINRTVKPGCERAFEEALHEFAQNSLPQPGQLGVHITRPTPGSGSREYRIMRKFASREMLNAFRASPEYVAWNRSVRSLTEGDPRIEELSGLESWFTPPDLPLRPLPKWKMALVSFLAVYPLTLVLPPFFGSVLAPAHPMLVNAATTAVTVVCLSWAIMPLLTRLLHGWLHAAPS
jgi:antibiotic biosynthesis monooxygenase (ABM) superfamily enzyme